MLVRAFSSRRHSSDSLACGMVPSVRQIPDKIVRQIIFKMTPRGDRFVLDILVGPVPLPDTLIKQHYR
jgi:hypothetical protein